MRGLAGALVLCALVIAPAGARQGAARPLRGQVTDSTGGVLPGVPIEVALAGVRVAAVTTDSAGTFVVNNLAPGEYSVSVSLMGFKTTTERVRVTAAGPPGSLAIVLQTASITEIVEVGGGPVNTMWADVGQAYADIRRYLERGSLPPPDSVYIEALINAFHFDYPAPREGWPFSVAVELGRCPWNPRHELAFVGVWSAPARWGWIHIAFNPARVEAYHLIGDEHRIFANLNDRRDAGDIMVGQTATALYEIVRPGADPGVLQSIGPMKYQRPFSPALPHRDDLMAVTVRDKGPAGDVGTPMVVVIGAAGAKASTNLGFAAAVAEFGLLLGDSPFKAKATWRQATDLAKRNRDDDPDGSRAEFIRLVEVAAALERRDVGK